MTKYLSKYHLLLLCLVAGVYVMRDSNFSFSRALLYPVRILATVRPSATLCTATELSEAYTADQISRAQSFKESLQSLRGGNPLKKMLLSGSTSKFVEDYALPLVPFVAPWGVMFFLTYFCCCGLYCNWCCMYGLCKNTKCCKCCKEPKNQAKKRIYIALSVLFLLGTVGSGIAGIIVSSGVSKGMELTLCSLLSAIEDLSFGVPSLDWIGLTPAITSIQGVLNNFDSTITSLSSIASSFTTIDNNLNNAKSQISTEYNARKTETAPRANPTVGGTYQPTVIQTIGPGTTDTTVFGMIQAEMQLKRDVAYNATSFIDTAVTTLKSSQASIKSSIGTGLSAASDISKAIDDLLSMLNDFGKIAKSGISGVGIGLTAIFVANLVLAIFAIASIVMVGVLKVKFFNKFLHLSWCVIGIFTLFGWILALLFYPLSVVLMETCDVYQEILTNNVTMGTVMDAIPGMSTRVKGVINTCFFSVDKDILKEFSLDSSLADFNTIFNQLDAVTQKAGIDLDSSSNPPCLTLTYWQGEVAKYKDGTYADAPETVTDLASLNSIVQSGGSSSCTSLRDTWALNSANCTSSMGATFASSSASTYDIPNPTCIGFNIWNPPTHDITTRYTSANFPTASCGASNSYTAAISFVNNFRTNRNSVSTIFTNVQSSLTQISNQYNTFATSLMSVIGNFKSVRDKLVNLRDSLIGDPDGLLRNAKCGFIPNALMKVSDAMCVGFISSVYQSSVVIIITSAFTFFGFISVFCLAKRFIVEGDEKKTKPV